MEAVEQNCGQKGKARNGGSVREKNGKEKWMNRTVGHSDKSSNVRTEKEREKKRREAGGT